MTDRELLHEIKNWVEPIGAGKGGDGDALNTCAGIYEMITDHIAGTTDPGSVNAASVETMQQQIAQLEKLVPARGAVFEAMKRMFRSLQEFEAELAKDHRVANKILVEIEVGKNGQFTHAVAKASRGDKQIVEAVNESSYEENKAISYALTEVANRIFRSGP